MTTPINSDHLLTAAIRLTDAPFTSDEARVSALRILCEAAKDRDVADRIDDDRDAREDDGYGDFCTHEHVSPFTSVAPAVTTPTPKPKKASSKAGAAK